jgi:hypothetical protein
VPAPRNTAPQKQNTERPYIPHKTEQKGKPFGGKEWLRALAKRNREIDQTVPDLFNFKVE